MSRLAAIVIAVAVCIIVSSGQTVNCYCDNAAEYRKQRDEKAQALNLASVTITNMTTWQRDVATPDAKHMKELADAKKQLDDLQHCVHGGKCGLRVNAKCPVNEATSTNSTGDVSSPRLADSAQRDYSILRERIVTAMKQVDYLQDYINAQCK